MAGDALIPGDNVIQPVRPTEGNERCHRGPMISMFVLPEGQAQDVTDAVLDPLATTATGALSATAAPSPAHAGRAAVDRPSIWACT